MKSKGPGDLFVAEVAKGVGRGVARVATKRIEQGVSPPPLPGLAPGFAAVSTPMLPGRVGQAPGEQAAVHPMPLQQAEPFPQAAKRALSEWMWVLVPIVGVGTIWLVIKAASAAIDRAAARPPAPRWRPPRRVAEDADGCIEHRGRRFCPVEDS